MSDLLTIAADDGSFPARVMRPSATPAPVVVVLHEIYGIDADVLDTCDQLAANGYLALCPELFWRSGPGTTFDQSDAMSRQKAVSHAAAFDLDRAMGDVSATLDAARRLADVTPKLGTLGYGLGGVLAFRSASSLRVDASVAYCAVGIGPYLEQAGRSSRPVLLHLADDTLSDAGARAAIHQELDGDPRFEIYDYPGCEQGFARSHAATFDAAAARLSDSRTTAFLRAYLR